MRCQRVDDERGASLLAVIVFVTVFSVVTSAILHFASTGFRTSRAIGGVRTELHVVDGAVDAAINAIRGSKKGLPSEGDCPPFTLDATADDPEVVVTCQPVGTPTGGVFDDQPAWAVLTLGTSAGEGVNKTGNFHTVIAGGVFSNKDMIMNAGSSCRDVDDDSCNALTVYGDAIALGTCTPNSGVPDFTPTRLFTPTGGEKTCLRGVSDPDRASRGEDPGYPTALGYPADLDGLTPQQVIDLFGGVVDPPGTCHLSNNLVKFRPGLYTQQLTNLVPSACQSASTWWLSPSATDCSPPTAGIYYLDFRAGAALWSLVDDNRTVVGGKLTAGCSISGGAAVPVAMPTFPTPCVEDQSGVQLIFGGESRMVVKDNSYKLALCASPAGVALTNQRIALYGLPTGTKDAAVAGAIEEAASASSAEFVSPANARSADGLVATAALRGGLEGGVGAVKTATLALDAFADIPVGSTVQAATLEVIHREAGPKPFTLSATWRSVDRLSQPVATDKTCSTFTTGGTFHTDVCDLMPAFTTSPFGPYHYRTFNGIDPVTLTVSSPSLAALVPPSPPSCTKKCEPGTPEETATVDVDAVILRVTYTPPGFEAHVPAADNGCGNGTGAALLKSCNNPVTEVHGTVYAPTARMLLNVHNRNFTNFSRGVILRTLDLDASASNQTPDLSPISLPGASGPAPRIVLFTASIAGTPQLRARVQYIDRDSSGEFVGYEVKVLDWQVIR